VRKPETSTPYVSSTLVKPQHNRVEPVAPLPDEKFTRTAGNAREANLGRRRVPRRAFESPIGLLAKGGYELEQSYQVGEGGMMFSSSRKLVVGQQVVISFYLPDSPATIVVRGIVRSTIPSKDGLNEKYGVEFLTLGFQYKREIRNFVASATGLESA